MSIARIILFFFFASTMSFFATYYYLKNSDRFEPSFGVRSFSGSDYIIERLANITPPYTIDIILKSKHALGGGEYTDYSPPMPFISGPLKAYHRDDKISFYDGKKTIAAFDRVNHWNRITYTTDDQQQSTLYINGKKAWSGTINPEITAITLGKGYAKRYWAGDFRRFRILQGLLYKADFDPDENAIVQGVSTIYDLKVD